MSKEEGVRVEGVVLTSSHDIFKIRIDGENEHIVEAKPSGRIRTQHIKITDGDRVIVELSPYDLKRGRIVYRKQAQYTES